MSNELKIIPKIQTTSSNSDIDDSVNYTDWASTQNDLGNISGSVSINASDASFQYGTTNGDVTGFSISNLDENPFLLQIDNSGGHSITIGAADYTMGTIPTSGIFCIYFYQIGSDVFSVISDELEAV